MLLYISHLVFSTHLDAITAFVKGDEHLNPLDQVITVAEAVELSGFNVRKVQRYCKSGKFIARQDLKLNWLILKSSIQSKEEVK